MADEQEVEKTMQERKGITRREFLTGTLNLIKIATGIAIASAIPAVRVGSAGAEGQRDKISEYKETDLYKTATKVAEKLGWEVKTAPVRPEYYSGKCVMFHESKDWAGCVEVFNGFNSPFRSDDFEPAAYLVYAWTGKDSNHQLIVAHPKEGLPLASGNWSDGSLLRTLEEQKDAAKKFGFNYPDNLNNEIPKDTIGPIGFWALSREELQRLGNEQVIIP